MPKRIDLLPRKRFATLVLLLTIAFRGSAAATENSGPSDVTSVPIRALLIVAHPDDEYEMAGTIYKITQELSGVVDQVIITDGEGGYRYSYLANRYYGVDLTNESVGRANLPRIREEEARGAARILNIRRQWFLKERDDRFTLSTEEALRSWRGKRVSDEIGARLRKGRYDVVFVLLPTSETHGGHKAATVLALEAVERLPPSERPAVLGAEASPDDKVAYSALSSYPITATISSVPEFQFDRDVRLGYRNSLSYQIVVNWVIAEHKSQGLFQTKCGQDRFENFWVFNISGTSALSRTAAFLERVVGESRAAPESATKTASGTQSK